MNAFVTKLARVFEALIGDRDSDRLVPPTGFTATLTLFTAAAMAFLAVFALALSQATSRVADRWSDELARSATIRIAAPPAELDAQTAAAQEVLRATPGIANSRTLSEEEQRLLLEPWFGPGLPVEELPLPRLIEVVADAQGYDAEGLRLRLAAEVPGAVLDDHTRWREPLIKAAGQLRLLGWVAVLLIALSLAAMVTLAARAALAANKQVLQVTRLIGAQDSFIARAFVRRFTVRALGGAAIGTILAMLILAALPIRQGNSAFLTGLAFEGAGWLLPLLVPPVAGITAFWATRVAALKTVREVT